MIVTEEQLKHSPRGHECTFVKIGDAGLKLYTDEALRDETFRWQQLWESRGLAPKCWFMFNFIGPEGNTLYAYYTEVVETYHTEENGSRYEYDAASEEIEDMIWKDYKVDWWDAWCENVGKKDGKFVIIDFGCMKQK